MTSHEVRRKVLEYENFVHEKLEPDLKERHAVPQQCTDIVLCVRCAGCCGEARCNPRRHLRVVRGRTASSLRNPCRRSLRLQKTCNLMKDNIAAGQPELRTQVSYIFPERPSTSVMIRSLRST